mgnify:CR=1 FL=1
MREIVDVVSVQNIDNVVPEDRQDEVVLWKRLLIGLTVRLETAIAELRQRKLLRRLLVTPMSRPAFLASFLLARMVLPVSVISTTASTNPSTTLASVAPQENSTEASMLRSAR